MGIRELKQEVLQRYFQNRTNLGSTDLKIGFLSFEVMELLNIGAVLLRPISFTYLCYQIQGITHPLTMEGLRTMRTKLQEFEPNTKKLIACLDVVLRNFHQEPPCVKENATLTIKSCGVTLLFSSGNGKCNISVEEGDGDIQYNVSECSGAMYLSRLCCRPQPLNVASLQTVKEALERWEMGENLRRCLNLVLQEFPKEPTSVQENAQLVITTDKIRLEFISGMGRCEISTSFKGRKPYYHVEVKDWEMYRDRLPMCKEPLSIRNLERIRRKVRFLEGTPMDVRKCLNIALQKFHQEPEEVRKNAHMVIEVEGGEIKLVSGNGANRIDVCCNGREICYRCVPLMDKKEDSTAMKTLGWCIIYSLKTCYTKLRNSYKIFGGSL